MTEEWKPIDGTLGRYEVSSLGRARSLRGIKGKPYDEPRVLCPIRRHGGYLTAAIYYPHRRTKARIYVLVLEAFVGPRPRGSHASHLDGDPANNALSNLRWESRAENERRKIGHGTHNRGMRHGLRKLTDADVAYIRTTAARGNHQRLAHQLGVSRSAVSAVARGARWKHAGVIANDRAICGHVGSDRRIDANYPRTELTLTPHREVP